MSKNIWKYPLKIESVQHVEIPQGARLLTVQTQYGKPVLWALVDPQLPKEKILIRTVATGEPVADAFDWTMKYLATYQLDGGDHVFHVFY